MEIEKFTIDSFLGGKLQIKQPARGYRIGMDTVLLASAAKPKADAKVLDLGCGAAEFGRVYEFFDYTGADLPHVIEGAAKKKNPNLKYLTFDIFQQICYSRTESFGKFDAQHFFT